VATVFCNVTGAILSDDYSGDVEGIGCGQCGRRCPSRQPLFSNPDRVSCMDVLMAAERAGFTYSARNHGIRITIPGDCVLVCAEVLGEGKWITQDGAGGFSSHWATRKWIEEYPYRPAC
jgi:hypothetical protein